jgi:hypothetical protein
MIKVPFSKKENRFWPNFKVQFIADTVYERLSALGGSVGLYLGLSVLSILFLLVDSFPKMQDVSDK